MTPDLPDFHWKPQDIWSLPENDLDQFMVMIAFIEGPLWVLSPKKIADYYQSLDNNSKAEILLAAKSCSEFFSHALDFDRPWAGAVDFTRAKFKELGI